MKGFVYSAMLVAAVMISLLPSGAWADSSTRSNECAPVNNVEVILDDSGSMRRTDRYLLRKQALNLMLSKPANVKLTLGVVEFGTDAASIFSPTLIGTDATRLMQLLEDKVKADNHMTNYNAGFTLASNENPQAGARIFLTDGKHNQGLYVDGHRGGPKTYVISFAGPRHYRASRSYYQRLQRIADETGGHYYHQTSSDDIQSVVNEIDGQLKCASEQQSFKEKGLQSTHQVNIESGVDSVELVLSWSNPNSSIDIQNVSQPGSNNNLNIQEMRGPTYVIVHISGVGVGKLRYSVIVNKRIKKTKVISQINQLDEIR